MEEDEVQRKKEYEEAMKYAELAAKADWEQQFGHLELTEDGDLIDTKTGEPVEEGEASGYTRSENGEWLKDGKPIFGRQFMAGVGNYDPSKFAAASGGAHRNSVELKAVEAEYGHKETNWKKPDWMKVSILLVWKCYDLYGPLCSFFSQFCVLLVPTGQAKEDRETCMVGRR